MKAKHLIYWARAGIAIAIIVLLVAAIEEGFGWSASCSTTWNGNGWTSCASAGVQATNGGTATLVVSAPGCVETGADRYGRARHGIPIDAEVHCPQGGGKCCATANWTATYGETYAAFGYNTSILQSCGPTTATIYGSQVSCSPDNPGGE